MYRKQELRKQCQNFLWHWPFSMSGSCIQRSFCSVFLYNMYEFDECLSNVWNIWPSLPTQSVKWWHLVNLSWLKVCRPCPHGNSVFRSIVNTFRMITHSFIKMFLTTFFFARWLLSSNGFRRAFSSWLQVQYFIRTFSKISIIYLLQMIAWQHIRFRPGCQFLRIFYYCTRSRKKCVLGSNWFLAKSASLI